MSNRHDVRLEKPELAIKDASRRLIGACGGGDGAGETIGRRQQHMSDCGNRFTDCFLRVDEAARLEDVSAGLPGWPHVTREMARRQGFVLAPALEAAAGVDWGGEMQALHAEVSATTGAVCQALSDLDTPGTITAAEVAEHDLAGKFERLMEIAARGRALALAAGGGRG